MPDYSKETERKMIVELARRYEVSEAAVQAVLEALAAGNLSMAQFNHPDLGGLGQWTRGGMIMIGDMFNSSLKYKVGSLCQELALAMEAAAQHLDRETASSWQQQRQGSSCGNGGMQMSEKFGNSRWPAELGKPAAAGSQNDLHYAYFPQKCRLAVLRQGQLKLYDTAEHQITSFWQQQGFEQGLAFKSQFGVIGLSDLSCLT